MNAIVELVQPIKKTRKPREVTIAELRAEIKDLKAWNKEIRRVIHKLSGELTAERAHTREMMAITRRLAFPPAVLHCTCTPTRADFLRAIARD
jgi:predicted RNase H-like nuclease (RuvC/YqgF family)